MKVFAALSRGPADQLARFYSREFLRRLGAGLRGDAPETLRQALTLLCNLALSVDRVFDDLLELELLDFFAEAVGEDSPPGLLADALDLFKTLVYREEAREVDLLLNRFRLVERVLGALLCEDRAALKAALECLEALLEFGARVEALAGENVVLEELRRSPALANLDRAAGSPHALVRKHHAHLAAKFEL